MAFATIDISYGGFEAFPGGSASSADSQQFPKGPTSWKCTRSAISWR